MTDSTEYVFPLSFAQQRLWLLDRMAPGHPFYNIPLAIPIQAQLDIAVLERALNAIIARQESLRTVFDEIDGEPAQIVRAAMPLTIEEIDKTMAIFTEAKKNGQFRAFWKSFDESVNLMASGEVIIQSMWSPAITAVKSKGIPCVYQPLKEGYRSWGGGLGLSANLSGLELEAAYEYINWYLSGWVGGYLMRQGYYSAVPDTSKAFMSDNECGFWYEGKEATADITSPTGDKLGSAGEPRDGGSYLDRMGSVVCWNSVMDENQYMVRKWNEFIAA